MDSNDGQNPDPELPEEFWNRIRQLAGSEGKNVDKESLVFVMERKLNASDIDDSQHRLVIQPVKNSFLTIDEDERLKQKLEAGRSQTTGKEENPNPVPAWIIDPDLEKSSITLRMWKIGKSAEHFKYVFINEWKQIVKKNNLRKIHAVRLWAVRVGVHRELWFALVKLPQPQTKAAARGNLLNRSSIAEQKTGSDGKNSEIELEAKVKKNTEIELEANVKKNSEIELEANMKKNSEIELEADMEKNSEIELEADKEKNSEIELEANMKKNSEIELEANMKKNSEIELEANIKMKNSENELEANMKKNSEIELEANIKMKNSENELDDKLEDLRFYFGQKLPIELVNKMKEIERGEVDESKILVIRKPLSSDDLDPSCDIFFIPGEEMLNDDFLKHREKAELDTIPPSSAYLAVELIDMNLIRHSVHLKRHHYSGYMVTEGWNGVKYGFGNQLRKGQLLELWAVRVGEDLWFVLRDVTPK
ncbi:hypothetical protein ACH5RR_007499 [Cinchona calisaya]|uniref:B3 domain-containing protein n=1 Tax=Cinchona calisaya TaxID=153742 RepID=A0ABD3ARZ4_9GENT